MAPKNVDDIYPLSPMQRLMLLHELTAAQPDVLTNQLRYRITGGLDEAAFRRACETVVARHPALRTGFLWEGFEQPLQVVRGTVRGFVRSVDATGIGEEQRVTRLDDIAAEDRRALQELSRAPLLRCTLVRTDMAEHLLIWTVHHLVADRWSHATVLRELRACYSAMTQEKVPDLAPAPAFRDYIHWISNQDAEAARRFWSSELEGLSTPTRIAGVGPRASSPQRQTCRRILSEDQTERLERRSTEWRTTPASLLLAGIGLAVARRTRTHEPVVGLTVAGRPPTLPTVEDAVGSFVNNVPVRFHLDRQHPVSEWVREVFVGQIRRQPFEHVSPADIQQAAGVPASTPLFDMLVLQNLDRPPALDWPGVKVEPVEATLDAGYPLLLSTGMADDRVALLLVHDVDFEEAEALLDDIVQAVDALICAPSDATLAAFLPEFSQSRTDAARTDAAHGSSRPVDANGDDLSDDLLEIWRVVLDVDRIGLDDDFFVLGGTSLQAAELFQRVEHRVGRALPLSTLFSAGTVRALLSELEQPVEPASSLVAIRSGGSLEPLVVVPGIGGNVVSLTPLARAVGPDQPVYGLQSKGLDGAQPPLRTIEAIAEDFIEALASELAGPIHLLGICWGAAVAFEMAGRLAERGRSVGSLALLDPATLLRGEKEDAPSSRLSFLRERAALYWDEFLDADWSKRRRLFATRARKVVQVVRTGEMPEESQVEINQRKVRDANREAVERYDPRPLAVRARVFITADRELHADADPRLAWVEMISPRPQVIKIPGVNSGDAIGPEQAGAFATRLLGWLDTLHQHPV